MKLDTDDRNYEEIEDKEKLLKTLYEKLDEYNMTYPNKMELVFF